MGSIDLKSALEKHGIDFKHADGSSEYRVCCPICGESKYRLWMNESKGMGICFRCSEGGSIRKFLTLLGIQTDIGMPKKKLVLPQAKPKESTPVLPSGAVPLWRTDSVMAAKARAYLINKRGLLESEIEQYKIHLGQGELVGNIIFPIYDVDGTTLIGWQARRFILSGQKSKNPVGNNGRLFNLDKCVDKWGLLIVEGPFDAICCHRKLSEAGIGVVALLGHSMSINQAAMIRHVLKPEKVWLMLDPDAYSDQQKLGILMRRESLNVFLCPKQRGDPDELSQEELLDALDFSVTF